MLEDLTLNRQSFLCRCGKNNCNQIGEEIVLIAPGFQKHLVPPIVTAVLGILLQLWYVIILSGLLILFVLFFFRDPSRHPEQENPNMILAPADGTIQEISTDLETNSILIRTTMTVFNVHVTRAPITGQIIESGAKNGAHYPIFFQQAKTQNQRKHIILENSKIKATIIFIAGFLARQIALYVKMGDTITQGQRLGIIKFGSEVDLIIHQPKIDLLIKKGDKTRAGETVIGVIKD